MRDFFKLFPLLLVPAFLFILIGTYVADKGRFRSDLERLRPNAVAEKALKIPTPDLRGPDLAQRASAGGAKTMQQIGKEMTDIVTAIDKAIQKGLSSSLGFSAAAADFATMVMGWASLFWAGLLASFMMIRKMASPRLRQRLITGGSGAQARTGGIFELPH